MDIGEEAWRMIEAVVEPSIEEMQKLQASAFHKAAREYCIGIMEGLAQYRESGSVVPGWAMDAPDDFIRQTCDACCKRETTASDNRICGERCGSPGPIKWGDALCNRAGAKGSRGHRWQVRTGEEQEGPGNQRLSCPPSGPPPPTPAGPG